MLARCRFGLRFFRRWANFLYSDLHFVSVLQDGLCRRFDAHKRSYERRFGISRKGGKRKMQPCAFTVRKRGDRIERSGRLAYGAPSGIRTRNRIVRQAITLSVELPALRARGSTIFQTVKVRFQSWVGRGPLFLWTSCVHTYGHWWIYSNHHSYTNSWTIS